MLHASVSVSGGVSRMIPNLDSFLITSPSHRIHAIKSADLILLLHSNELVKLGLGTASGTENIIET